MLDRIVSDRKADVAGKGHQASVAYWLVQRDGVEKISKFRALTRPHLRAKRTVVLAYVIVHQGSPLNEPRLKSSVVLVSQRSERSRSRSLS